MIYKNGLVASKLLQLLIYTELSDKYIPAESIFPKAKQLFNDPPLFFQPPKLLTKNDIFVIPICKYRSLAIDIAKTYNFDDRLTALLVEKMPEYLYSAKLPVKDIPKTIGDQAFDVIKVYRSLVQPDFYNRKDKPSFQEELKKKYDVLCKLGFMQNRLKKPFSSGFDIEESAEISPEDSYYTNDLLEEYLIFPGNLDDAVFALGFYFPASRFTGEILEYYKQTTKPMKKALYLLAELREKNKYREDEDEDEKDQVKEKKKRWELLIEEHLGLDQALSILERCFGRGDAQENAQKILAKCLKGAGKLSSLLDEIKGSPENMALFTDLLYKRTIYIVRQACMGILWRANVILYQRDKKDAPDRSKRRSTPKRPAPSNTISE